MAANKRTLMNDAIAMFTKTVLSLADDEEKARQDVIRLTSEAENFRNERDTAQKALHNAQMEVVRLKAESESWRSRVDQEATTLKHQREITDNARRDADNCRREAQQWKEQFRREEEVRLQQVDEKTREAQDWKERCRLEERERFRLSSRLEDMMSSTNVSTPSGASHTSFFPTPHDLSTSLTAPTASSSKTIPSPVFSTADHDAHHRIVSKRPRQDNTAKRVPPKATTASRAKSRQAAYSDEEYPTVRAKSRQTVYSDEDYTAVPRSATKSSAPQLPNRAPELIRRVHAVITMPVKEEDDAAEGVESAGLFDSGSTQSASASGSGSSHSAARADLASRTNAPTRGRAGEPLRTKSGRVVKPVDAYADAEPREELPYSGSEGELSDREEYDDEDVSYGHRDRRAKRKQPRVSSGRSRDVREEDEADDLMLVSEDEDAETYGRRHVVNTPKSSDGLAPRKKITPAASSASKRKRAASNSRTRRR